MSLFAVLDDGGVLGQRAQLVWLHPVFILLRPTRVALASRASVSAFLDRAFADGVGQHFRGELVGGGEVDFVAEVKQEHVGLLPISHGRDVGGGRLGGIDRGGPRAANFVHHVVIRNTVFADEDGFLGLVQDQHDQVFLVPYFGGQVVPPEGVKVKQHLQEQADVLASRFGTFAESSLSSTGPDRVPSHQSSDRLSKTPGRCRAWCRAGDN